MPTASQRHWPLPDTHNIRDLGGYGRSNGGTTQWRRVLRGDSLVYLTPFSVAALVERGLGTVIDLRAPRETEVEPSPFAEHARVAYRNIALYDAMAPAELGFDMADRYIEALDRCGPQMAEVLGAIAAAPEGVVLFNCTAGKDRTGLVSALVLLLAGVSEADIAEDYALTASLALPMLARLRQRALAAGSDPAHVEMTLSSRAETMAALLDHLRAAHGGVDRYLYDIGLDRADAARVVTRLCD